MMEARTLIGLTIEEAEKLISPKCYIHVVTSQTPINDGYDPYRYNVIIANNVIHACSIG